MTQLTVSLLFILWLGWAGKRALSQKSEIVELRQRLVSLEADSPPESRTDFKRSFSGAPVDPSPELLRARGEVAQLRNQVAQRTTPGLAASAQASDADSGDLERLMKDRLPSRHPDFVSASSLRNQGFDTPDHALESFWWHFSNPGQVQSDTFSKLWWSPEEEAPEGYHYSIHLGMGVGSFTGYRVVQRKEISPDEVVFKLDREEGRSIVEEEARFVRVGDHWVRKPVVRLVKKGE